MPDSEVTIKAAFLNAADVPVSFADVSADDYYYEAVLWAVSQGITLGTDDAHFSPDADCARGQLVTFCGGRPESPRRSRRRSFPMWEPTPTMRRLSAGRRPLASSPATATAVSAPVIPSPVSRWRSCSTALPGRWVWKQYKAVRTRGDLTIFSRCPRMRRKPSHGRRMLPSSEVPTTG